MSDCKIWQVLFIQECVSYFSTSSIDIYAIYYFPYNIILYIKLISPELRERGKLMLSEFSDHYLQIK